MIILNKIHVFFRYDTAYGNALLVKQLLERQLNLNDFTNVLEKTFPKQRVKPPKQDYFKYRKKIRRDYDLCAPKGGIRYYQGDIDKRLIEAKQRINKTWRKELRDYFRKEKKTEDVVLRRADTMTKGLKAYLKGIDKDIEKYERDESIASTLRKCNGMDTVGELQKKFKKFEPRISNKRRLSFQVDAITYDFDLENLDWW